MHQTIIINKDLTYKIVDLLKYFLEDLTVERFLINIYKYIKVKNLKLKIEQWTEHIIYIWMNVMYRLTMFNSVTKE